MEPLQIALCEDHPAEQQLLLSRIQVCPIPAEVFTYENAETFLGQYQTGRYDLILMDIYLDGISGVEAVRRIREKEEDLPIAFTTASKDHALDGYRLNVVRYLEKPVSQRAVNELLSLIWEKKQDQPEEITVFLQRKPFSISVRQLLYIEQNAHYLIFHFTGNKTMCTKGRLDELAPQLEEFPFFRCHKSFLANLSFVTGINRELMLFSMKEGNAVYIRRENFRKAKDAWESWLFSRARKGGIKDD